MSQRPKYVSQIWYFFSIFGGAFAETGVLMLRDDLGSSRSTLCLRFGSADRGGGDTYVPKVTPPALQHSDLLIPPHFRHTKMALFGRARDMVRAPSNRGAHTVPFGRLVLCCMTNDCIHSPAAVRRLHSSFDDGQTIICAWIV